MRPEMYLGSRATVANPFDAVGVILCWLAVIEVRRLANLIRSAICWIPEEAAA
jgi:hypothetical protein